MSSYYSQPPPNPYHPPPMAQVGMGYSEDSKGPNTRVLSAPPSYPGYQATYSGQPPVAYMPVPLDTRCRRDRNRSARIRLIHFLALLAAVTILVHFFFRDIRRMLGFWGPHHHDTYPGGAHPYPVMDITLPDECSQVAEWTNLQEHPDHWHGYHFTAETNVEVPVDSDLLYIIHQGSLANGGIEFLADGDDSENAIINVKIGYRIPRALDHAKICKLHREVNKNGVGIITPEWHGGHIPQEFRVTFGVIVHLPVPQLGSKLNIKGLETRLPLFAHKVGNLEETVNFHWLHLSSSNMPVHVESLYGELVKVETSNNAIEGRFNTSDQIELHTSNGAIKTQIILDSLEEKKTVKASLYTSNSPITSDFSLYSSFSKDNTGGSFQVTTKTSNAPLRVTFPAAPLNSTLNYSGTTSNSPAAANLHRTYEGEFYVATSTFFRPNVHKESSEDPAGEGRPRHLETSSFGRGKIEGSVYWGQKDTKKQVGSVELTTSNAPVNLFV